MKIIFMGTPDIARKSLQRIYDEGYDVTAVYTGSDKPAGRGMKLRPSPVKELAQSNNTPVFHAQDLTYDFVTGLNPDIIAVVAYGRILRSEILSIPKLGCINIHGSVLPKYRGAAPIQHAVLNGEKETGVTSMYMSEEMDAGDIIFIRKIKIFPDDTSGDLFNRLGDAGAGLLADTLAAIKQGNAPRTAQNHNEATYAPMLSRDMSPLDFNDSAINVKRKIQAFIPWPVATMSYLGITIKVFAADITDKQTGLLPGTVLESKQQSNGIEIACRDGTVIITRLQAPGRKVMDVTDYLRGLR